MKKKIITLFLCAAMIFGSLSLSSCYLLDSGGLSDMLNNPSTGTQVGQNSTINVTGGDNYDITINPGADVNTLSANKALLSAVSIYCTFDKKAYGNTTQYSSAGSGVIYELEKEKGNAFIITNYHVVYSASATTANRISNDIKVFLYGQEGALQYAIPATYVGGSMQYDIAVLKIQNSTTLMESNARAADFANSDEIAILDTAIAIGNPEGNGISATLGHVNVDSEYISMVGPDERTEVSLRVIRTDAAVNHGNSGGGLFNTNGELIGIVNAKITSSSIDGIGYAIPSNVAKNITENILYYCDGTSRESVFRCILGITVESTEFKTEYDKNTGKLKKLETVRINTVDATSALKDKFKVGDVLLSVSIGDETQEITRRHHVIDALLNARPDSKLVFKILRGGVEMTVEHTVTTDMLVEYK